jgi:Flp pilus assembly protein TadD
MRAMASANMQLGYLGQSERLLRDAVELEPENAAIWNDLGVVLLEKGDVGEAHQAFRRAFAFDPNTPQILENLRVSLARLEELRYDQPEEEETFTLTRRRDGVFELSAAE